MMAIPDNYKRKRGRPATGITPLVGVRLSEAITKSLDQWATKNGFDSRAQAMRHLVEEGIKSKAKRP